MSKCFIILGCHRSATSLAAKGLHDVGVHMGEDLLGKSPSNPYGHYENRRFVDLNDTILQKAGGSWDRPPAHEKILKAGNDLSSRISQAVSMESTGHQLWGFKDPRTTLTIECYWPQLENPHLIVCFRNPVQVAVSLQKRDGFNLAKGMGLATEYNKRLLDFLQRHYLKLSGSLHVTQFGSAIVESKGENYE